MATLSEASVGSAEVRRLKRRWDQTPVARPVTQSFDIVPMTADRSGAKTRHELTEAERIAIASLQKTAAAQHQLLLQQLQVQQQQMYLASTQAKVHTAVARMWASNLDVSWSEDEVRKIFSTFGDVLAIQFQKEGDGKVSKTAFIDFANPNQADNAVRVMDNHYILGRIIKAGRPITTSSAVFPSTAVSASAVAGVVAPIVTPTGIIAPSIPLTGVMIPSSASAVAAAAAAKQSGPKNRIYVGSIPWDVTDEAIKQLFSTFGAVRSCNLLPNPETGKHKGYGFVEFEDTSSAEQAVSQMNGFAIAGRQIKVGWAAAGAAPVNPLLGNNPLLASLVGQNLGVTIPTSLTATGSSLGVAAVDPTKKKGEESLSHEENMTISSEQRYQIMQKLLRSDGMVVSRCVVLRNMVSPEEVDEMLEGEVMDECRKYGVVEKVVIYKYDVVKIFVLFQKPSEAELAQSKINNRRFGGRTVKVDMYDEGRFRSNDYSG
eukprot:TRINITY_DN6712_c0_g1_i1.p1 TRINITY_DN6712_c0_g1~~TRINITY_DN6712_c0_g1_i1.p1  ORF type:complete len:488 (+),score=110.21 TRINITY_DN6712_c0_g1_i1:61-1524(+)